MSLLCFDLGEGRSKDAIENLKSLFHKVQLVPLEKTHARRTPWHKTLREWVSPSPELFGRISSSVNMRKAIQSLLRITEFDLVHIACTDMISYFLDVKHVPVVFDSIDDPSLNLFRSMRQNERLLQKVKLLKDWLVIRKFEKKYFSKFSEIVVTSPLDAEIIRSFCPRSNVTVIPNGVDAQYFRPPSCDPMEPRLIFSGVMDYSQNILAMTFFCKSIFPLIRMKIPEAQLLIVGRNPVREILDLEKQIPGIEVTGTVEDIRPYLARSQVYVCPLKSGAGIKNKILEAWAAGLPIVATSLSCVGIEVSPGEDILIADDINGFVKAVVRLLQDESLRKKLAEKGRKKVVEKYDWESKAEMLEKIYVRAMKNFNIDVDN
ncbi:MAG: hypothetical protein A2W07_03725 [candidate division Zixibacteria bacterium RBG_16_43_9]|nr:MAG: hypothetical protein A2W07_03725 [candidate division Zixibacteria bacterium RBG_16_43_9]